MYASDLEWCLRFGRFIGSYPKMDRDWLQTVHYITLMIGFLSIPFLTVLMFLYDEEPITVMAVTVASGNFSLFFHASLKLTTAFVKRRDINELLKSISSQFWPLDNDADIIETTERARFKIRIIFFNSLVLFILSTIIKPHIAGRWKLLAYRCHRPQWISRQVFLILEDLICISMVCSFMYHDILVSTVITMTEIQFKMLNKKFRKVYDARSKVECDGRLQECTDHHNFLLKFLKNFGRTFSTTIFLFVGNMCLSMCVCLYNTTVGKPDIDVILDSMIHLPGGLNMIFSCYSLPAQALIDEANNIDSNAYSSRWYRNPAQSKDLLMVLIRNRKSTEIRVGGILKIDLQIFYFVCKTMVSYCMFLRTVSAMY